MALLSEHALCLNQTSQNEPQRSFLHRVYQRVLRVVLVQLRRQAIREELGLVEIANWRLVLLVRRQGWILCLEQIVRRLHPLRVRLGVVHVIPEGHVHALIQREVELLATRLFEGGVVDDANQVIQLDFTCELRAVRAGAGASRRPVALAAGLVLAALHGLLVVLLRGTRAGKGEPSARVVDRPRRKREATRKAVTTHEVAVLGKLILAHPRASAQAAVEGVSDAEVHASLVEWLGSFCLDLVAHDPADAETAGLLAVVVNTRHHLVVHVPHQATQVRSIDVHGRVLVRARGPVHVECHQRGL
mmetsp:Transcript_77077/g.216348  ORF Transcript_77077/g.216348 Transcript_77077/m.216348 type:complete len:303 (-) Transcript_77077:642-1550(-)